MSEPSGADEVKSRDRHWASVTDEWDNARGGDRHAPAPYMGPWHTFAETACLPGYIALSFDSYS